MRAVQSVFYFVLVSFLFMVSGVLQAADFYISDVRETTEDNAPALVVRFSNPIEPDTDLSRYISVTPYPDNGNIWLSQNGGRQWVLPFVEPSTEYKIKVERPIISADGYELSEKDSENNTHSFTRTVTTRKLVPSASFASSGNFLVGDIQGGIPVTVVNQKEVDLEVFRVRDDRLFDFIDSAYYQGRKSYYKINELKGFADLIHSARYENDARTNQRTTYNLNLDPMLDKGEAGVYVAVIRKAGQYDYYYDTTFFTITDIGLHARKYKNSLMLYTNSIATGDPIADVDLRLFWPSTDKFSEREDTAKVGENGSYLLSTNDLPKIVVAQKGKQVSFLKLDQGALDLSDLPNVPTLHQDYQMFMYGPRDLYRPGEEVFINLLLRDHDGQKIRNIPLDAKLYDARGERKRSFVWQSGATDLYQTSFALDDNAPTGSWRLEVSYADEVKRTYHFKVEEFLPETLTMSFYDGDRNKTRYVPRRTFSVPIQADYLYGAPASGNKADGVVTVSPVTTPFPELKGYYFGDSSQKISGRTRTLSSIKLDEKGRGELKVPNRWSASVPLKYSISASVYESGGRPITRTQNVIQLPGFEKFVGIQPQFKGSPDNNQNIQFKLLSVDEKGSPVEDKFSVRMLRNHREYFWEFDESRGWYWKYTSNRYVVGSSNVTTHGEPVLIDLPVEWGAYSLEVTSESGAKSVMHFRTKWSWGNQTAANLKPDMIQMVMDRDSYVPGETAKLRLLSPANGEGLINIESSEGVQYSMRQKIEKGSNEINIDIDEQWDRHDLYVTAMVLTPADQVSEVAPKRALGFVSLPIKRADAVAKVEITTPEKVQPNKVVSAQINVTNLAELGNQPLYATVALVDKGVLNITNYKRPKPEVFFYAPRRFVGAYYDIYGKIINNVGYESLRQRFGGDAFSDSDDELSRGGEKPKTDVQILSYFSEPVQLVDGQAEVSFELPTFNGKLEWMVVVYGDKSYGSTSSDMIVADKLVTQISMPRFLSMGDESQVTIDLHNLSDAEQSFDVSVKVNGSLTSDGVVQKFDLKDKEKSVLTVPITATDDEGQGEIQLIASNGTDINISRTWRLGVRSPYPWSTQQVRAVVNPDETWVPNVDVSSLRDNTVQAQLTISNRPAINFRSHLEYLLHYPYGCLEQTSSSTYPWLLMDGTMVTQLGIADSIEARFNEPYTESFRRKQIAVGINRLKSKQLSSGGFGYWDSSSSEVRWGTVYATELLVDARKQGIEVDSRMYKEAINRLSFYVRDQSKTDIWTDSSDYYHFAYRAYAAFVLSKAGEGNLSQLRRLYDQAIETAKGDNPLGGWLPTKDVALQESGLAWMHLAAALSNHNDVKRAKVANTKALNIKRSGYHYYRDYGSTMRDAALSLAVALEQGLDEGNLVEDMVESMRNKRWMSTQERIALAKVARQYSKSGREWSALLQLPSGEQVVEKDHAFNSVFDGEALKSLKGVQAEDQKLYVNLQYQGAPKTAPTAYSEGLHIERRYYDLQGNRITPSSLNSGELMVVGLNISSVDNLRVPEALVVDLLPAGLELENQNLSNASIDLDSIRVEGESLGRYFRERKVLYQEYRDDRYVAAISVDYYKPTQLYYLVRAVTPGTYQVAPPFVEDMYRPDYRSIGTAPGKIEILPR